MVSPGQSLLIQSIDTVARMLCEGLSPVAISVDWVNFHKKPNRLALVGQLLV